MIPYNKPILSVAIAYSLLFSFVSQAFSEEIQGTAAGEGAARVQTNPLIWADVPDTSVLRVGDVYYMSSTTMHMSPGLPIFYSNDLVNWKLASYAHGNLGQTDGLNLNNGLSEYGAGSWASSLRYHNGKFYVSTFANSTGRTHIFITDDPRSGRWEERSFEPALHDSSLFFDDNRVYMVYGNHNIRLIELKPDCSGVLPGGRNQVIIPEVSKAAGGIVGLGAEGSQMFKVNGKYYLFNITWPRGDMRTEIVSRADSITGPYETRVCMRDRGIAQGGIFDTPEGKWRAILFRDAGAVGRIPYLMPVEWKDGWPMLGVGGVVPDTMDLPVRNSDVPEIVDSDDFNSPVLKLVWQWNHNPDPTGWSLTARPGFLRLTTKRVDANLVGAKNTLTQRTFGPACSGIVKLDASGLKDGDFAGLCVLQKYYGFVGVKADGAKRNLVVVTLPDGQKEPQETVVATLDANQAEVFLRIDCNFQDQRDLAKLSYSIDGQTWNTIGNPLRMVYTLPHFMGYRYGLFHFSTRESGGNADFDWFRIQVGAKADVAD